MARPVKQGLDYFPLDVNCDDKVRMIDAKFGVVGFGILIKLWQIIYDNGYFINWSEKEVLLYKGRINADINLINDVINESVKWGLFNQTTYSCFGVLTSRGIQKRYLEAIRRRHCITVYLDFWELEIPENNEKLSVIIVPKTVIPDINQVNVDNNSINSGSSTQSKVKESKVKENRVNNTPKGGVGVRVKRVESPLFATFYEAYPRKAYRAEAASIFTAMNIDENLLADIMYGLDKWKASYDWTKENGRYIPQPARWLKNREWENEPPQITASGNGKARQLSVKEILSL